MHRAEISENRVGVNQNYLYLLKTFRLCTVLMKVNGFSSRICRMDDEQIVRVAQWRACPGSEPRFVH